MKWKKFFIAIFIISTVLFLGRTWLFKVTVKYNPIGKRELITISDQNLIQEIENWKSTKEIISAEEAIKFSLNFTAKELKFSTKNGLNSDPNKLPESEEANCVGYSKLFNSVSNYIFENTANLKTYKSTHLIGEISFLGIDLHKLSRKPFWKDHDYNRIRNLKTKKEYYVDPSVFDYFRITYIK